MVYISLETKSGISYIPVIATIAAQVRKKRRRRRRKGEGRREKKKNKTKHEGRTR